MVKKKSAPKKSTAKRWRQAFEVIRFCGAEPEEAARLIMRHTELKKMQEADAAASAPEPEPIEVEIEEPASTPAEEVMEEEPLEEPEPEEPEEPEPEEEEEEEEPESEPEEPEEKKDQFSVLRSLMSGSFLPSK